MAERKTSGDDAALERGYREVAREAPSAALDARIRAAAHAAVAPPTPRRIARRLIVPLSLAATVVLSVGVVLRLTQEGALTTEAPAPMAQDLRAPLEQGVPPAAPARAPKSASGSPAPESSADRAAPNAAPPATASQQARRNEAPAVGAIATQALSAAAKPGADVVGVTVRGRPGAYQFDVTVKSPDTGCDHYADWWEVIGTDGKLIYRRVLAHSHADEQPFMRSGGPVAIDPDTEVWVRAHMNTSAYGGAAWRGSPARGFAPAPLSPTFAAAAANEPPQPDGCAF